MKNMDKWLFTAAFFLFPTIYVVPYLLTYLQVPFSALPLDFSSDIYLYLNYSQLQVDTHGMTQNPWYHTQVPAMQLPYLKFGLLHLFSGLNTLIGNTSLTLVVWNWLWSAVTFVCAYLLFREVAGKEKALWPLFGVSLLFFFQVSDLPQVARGFLHLSFDPVLLPLQRVFFPQLATPLLLIYFLMLIHAFRKNEAWMWVLLFLIQYVAFVNFPYNTVMMGATTFFYILFALLTKTPIPWKPLIFFAIAVVAADLAFVMEGRTSFSEGRQALFDPDLSRLHELFGGTYIVLFALTFTAILLPEKRKHIKLLMVSSGVAMLTLQMSDLFFNPSLQLTHHFAYFIHKIIALLLFYDFMKIVELLPRGKKALSAVALFATVVLVLSGIFSSAAQAKAKLPEHLAMYRTYTLLHQLQPDEKDLLIAPAATVNDTATWLPLLFKSQVLFSRNSEFLLPKESDIYWQKESLYLYLKGLDTERLRHILLSGKTKDAKIQRIIQVPQRFDLHTDRRQKMLESVYQKLARHLKPLENGETTLHELLAGHQRVILIDRADRPTFVNAKSLGQPKKVLKAGNVVIRIYDF